MNIFESIIDNNVVTIGTFLICILSALISGFSFSWMCYYKSHSSKSFFVATSILPACVALVIMFVNREIGTGVAIAGAFSLVRFRSMPGSAKEIAIIFIDMAMGLAFGMGFIAYGILFGLISGLLLMLFAKTNLWDKSLKTKEKVLKITIPEDLDYCNVFNDLFDKYTSNYQLIKTKTINMGSMFRLSYRVVLKEHSLEKAFIDDLRCRNGNLEISLSNYYFENNEL